MKILLLSFVNKDWFVKLIEIESQNNMVIQRNFSGTIVKTASTISVFKLCG